MVVGDQGDNLINKSIDKCIVTFDTFIQNVDVITRYSSAIISTETKVVEGTCHFYVKVHVRGQGRRQPGRCETETVLVTAQPPLARCAIFSPSLATPRNGVASHGSGRGEGVGALDIAPVL